MSDASRSIDACLPLGVERQIDRLCDEFEQSWEAGSQPRIEDYLERIEPAGQAALLRELIGTELDFRRSNLEVVDRSEYHERFAEFDVVVEAAFTDPGDTDFANAVADETVSFIADGVEGEAKADLDFELDVEGAQSPPGYKIVGKLGRGGMGVVYLARQSALKRMVALKMIRAGSHGSDEEFARFRDEAEAVAQLKHPNIVQIYEVGECGGLPYFSLEYIDGRTLQQHAGGEPLPPDKAAALLETLARAMHYAHQRGIIHRDLKPANVLLEADGTPKIADFGLAKRLDSDSGRTRTGNIVGTPKYMSPEQARGDKNVGHLTDVYALGVILYELLTGRAPFLGATPLDTLSLVVNSEPVSPAHLQPKITRDLETICLKCLQKDPAQRYHDAAALADDLRRYQAGEPIVARPISRLERSWRWCKRKPVVAGLSATSLMLLLTTLVILVVANQRITDQRDEAVDARKLAAENARSEKVARQQAEEDRKAALIAEQEAREARIEAEDQRDAARIAQQMEEQAKQEAEGERIKAEAARKEADDALVQTLEAYRSLVYNVQDQLKDRPSVHRLRTNLLESAVTGLKKVALTAADDVSATVDVYRAAAYRRLGEIFLQIGRSEEAERQFQRCHEIVVALHKVGDLRNVERNMSRSLNNLGKARLQFGDMASARSNFQRALEFLEQLLANEDDDGRLALKVRFIEDFSDTNFLLGKVARQNSQARQALKYFMELRDIRSAYLDRFPNKAVAKTQLAGAYADVGEAYQQLGYLEKAFDSYERARQGFQPFAQRKESTVHRFNEATVLEKLANVCLWMKEFERAQAYYLRAKERVQRLSNEDVLNARTKRTLALQYTGLGVTGERLNQANARQYHNTALEIHQKLYDEDKSNALKKAELMHAYGRVGDHEKAIVLANELVKQFNDNPRFLKHVATGYSLCVAAVAQGKPKNVLIENDSKLRNQYAHEAIRLLQKAVDCNYKSWATLEFDPDLDPIRDREEFGQLLKLLKATVEQEEEASSVT